MLFVGFMERNVRVNVLQRNLVRDHVRRAGLQGVERGNECYVCPLRIDEVIRQDRIITNDRNNGRFQHRPCELTRLFTSVRRAIACNVSFIRELSNSVFETYRDIRSGFRACNVL